MAMPARTTETIDDLVVIERLDGDRWTPRRWAARALLCAWVVTPIAVSFLVTAAAASVLGRPAAIAWQVAWFIGLTIFASAIVYGVQRCVRALVPLAALLCLDLAFPGRAPKRFRIALRAGNPREVLRRLDRTHANTLPDEAAGLLLELIGALSQHDRALRGHSERVRAYSELVAEELGLDEGARQGLRWAGLLHDVGKLTVAAEILNKTEQLTEEEWETIRTHPQAGANLCAALTPWLGEWGLGVLDHHERWEGGGYPRGLVGEEISLAGRVVAVTDAFDVMTSARSYQAPRPVEEAREELVRCQGTQFDPVVVRAFLLVDIPQLRALAGGLLAGLAAGLQRRSPAASAVLARVGTAACVACVAGLLVPVGPTSEEGGGGGPGPGGVATAPSVGHGPDGSDGAADGASLPSGGRFLGSLPRRGFGSGLPGLPSWSDDGAHPGDGLPGGPGDPGGPGGAGDPDGPDGEDPGLTPNPDDDGVALIVDPAAGSVELDGLGAPGAPPLPVVRAPVAGAAVCGAAQVCQPIVIPLPF